MSAMPGPILPSRLDVWKLAHRLEAMARHAKELADKRSDADLTVVLAKLDAMRALLGPSSSASGDESGAS